MLTLPRIALRQLTKKHTYGIISFTSIITVLGLSLGVSSLLLVNSFTNGFSKTIEDKLTNIDGHLRISKYDESFRINISQSEYSILDSILNKFKNISSTESFIEGNAIIRKGSLMEGVYVYGINNSALLDIFNLDKFILEGNFKFDNLDGIIIGKKIAETLNVKIGDQVYLFDLVKIINNGLFKANSHTVEGIISTGFPEYDNTLAFVPLLTAQNIFSENQNISGIIVNLKDKKDVPQFINNIEGLIGYYPYIVSSWKDRHKLLYNWLEVYHVPIKLVILFIIIMSICNIGVTLWMLVLEKNREIGILKTIGFNKLMIGKIYVYQGFIIGVIGSITGTILGLIVSLLQNKFQFITLSEDVYFIKYLPALIDWNQILTTILFSIILSVIMSLVPAIRAINVLPLESINYE